MERARRGRQAAEAQEGRALIGTRGSALVALALLGAACGARPPATSTNTPASATSSEPEPAPAATTSVSSCVADRDFTFSIAWPTQLRSDPLQLHTCAFAPLDATGDRLAWIVTVDVRDRGGGTPEPLDTEGATIVDRGELDVMGVQIPWVAIDDETPWTGPGRMVLAQLSLQRHDLLLGVVTATGSPPELGARLLAALATLRVQAATPRDGVPLDPTRSICGGDGGRPLLALTIPAGARTDDSFEAECVAFVGDDIDDPAWLLTVHVVAPDEPLADVLAIEPDGALRYLADDAGIPQPFARGTSRWLGDDAPWYAIERTIDGTPQLVVVSRAHVGTTIVLAMANLAPAERASIPSVIAALEGVRVLD